MLTLDFAAGHASERPPHEVVIFNINTRSEVRRWNLPDAGAYNGAFAQSGRAFCTVPDPGTVALEHRVTCRDIANGQETYKGDAVRGPLFVIGAGGDRIFSQHSAALVLPFSLFGTNYFLTHNDRFLSDTQTGRVVASWRIGTQWVLPKADASFESAVSPDGEMVAIGGSGVLRVYRVNR